MGYKRATELIKKFGDIETILKNLDSAKYPPPEDWLYAEARRLFKEPEVVDTDTLELKVRKLRGGLGWGLIVVVDANTLELKVKD